MGPIKRQRTAGDAGQPGADGKGHGVHVAGGHTQARRHVAVLHDGPQPPPAAAAVEIEVEQRHGHDDQADDKDALIGQDDAVADFKAAGQPGGADHVDVGGAEDGARRLLQHEGHAVGRQQRVERPPIEVADHRHLQKNAQGRGDEKGDRQRQHKPDAQLDAAQVGRQDLLAEVGGVGADHDELAVGHVDDVHQAKRKRQPQGDQQQDRTETQSVKDLQYQQFHVSIFPSTT